MGDPSGKFTEALDLSFESSSIFGNDRSKRYALLIEDGKVKEAFVEPDNTGVNGKQSSSSRTLRFPTGVFTARWWGGGKLKTNIETALQYSVRCGEGAWLEVLF